MNKNFKPSSQQKIHSQRIQRQTENPYNDKLQFEQTKNLPFDRSWSHQNSLNNSLKKHKIRANYSPASIQIVQANLSSSRNNSRQQKSVETYEKGRLFYNDVFSSRSTEKHDHVSHSTNRSKNILNRYENIANLTQQENENLKQQNKYLVQKLRRMKEREEKVRKMYEKAKQYKQKLFMVQDEIRIVKNEAKIYKTWIEDLQQIAIVDIPILQKKCLEAENEQRQNKEQKNNNQRKSEKYTPVKRLQATLKRPLTIEEEAYEETGSNQEQSFIQKYTTNQFYNIEN